MGWWTNGGTRLRQGGGARNDASKQETGRGTKKKKGVKDERAKRRLEHIAVFYNAMMSCDALNKIVSFGGGGFRFLKEDGWEVRMKSGTRTKRRGKKCGQLSRRPERLVVGLVGG